MISLLIVTMSVIGTLTAVVYFDRGASLATSAHGDGTGKATVLNKNSKAASSRRTPKDDHPLPDAELLAEQPLRLGQIPLRRRQIADSVSARFLHCLLRGVTEHFLSELIDAALQRADRQVTSVRLPRLNLRLID